MAGGYALILLIYGHEMYSRNVTRLLKVAPTTQRCPILFSNYSRRSHIFSTKTRMHARQGAGFKEVTR